MPDFFTNNVSDNFRLIRSKPLIGAAATAGTWSLIRLPKWAFVSGLWVWIETACNVEDITIGWSGNKETAVPAGFMSADILNATVVGYKTAVNDTLTSFGQKYFGDGQGAITATLGTTWASGKITVFCQYSVVH